MLTSDEAMLRTRLRSYLKGAYLELAIQLRRSRRWLGRRTIEQWLTGGLAIGGLVVLALILSDRLALWGGDSNDGTNRLYLLSAIVQALAAILALLVTLTLVATQLAAQAYSPRVVSLRLRDPWLWEAVGLYLVSILWALLSQGKLVLLGRQNTDIALLLSGAALLYLVPFTIATVRSMDPARIAGTLAEKQEDPALDDMMRKAVNDALMSVLNDGLQALIAQTCRRLDAAPVATGMKTEIARLAGARFLSVGRHACQRRDADALKLVQEALGAAITYSTERRWRDAANILNGVAAEMEDYALHSFGASDAEG